MNAFKAFALVATLLCGGCGSSVESVDPEAVNDSTERTAESAPESTDESAASSTAESNSDEQDHSFSNNPQVTITECIALEDSTDAKKIAAFIEHAEKQIAMLAAPDAAAGTVSTLAGGKPTPILTKPLAACVEVLRKQEKELVAKRE